MGKKWTRKEIEDICKGTFEPWEWKESRLRNIARDEAEEIVPSLPQIVAEVIGTVLAQITTVSPDEARDIARKEANNRIATRVASKARDGGNRELRNYIRSEAQRFRERWEWTEGRLRQIARHEARGVSPGEVRNITNDVVNDRIASKVRDGGNRELRNYIEAIGDEEDWGEYPEFAALIARAIEAVSELIKDMNLVERAEVIGVIDDAIDDRVAEAARDGGGNQELERFIRNTANAYLERYEWRGQTIRDMIQEEISEAGGINEQRAKELATETVNEQVASAAGGEAENSPLIEFLGGLAEVIGEWLDIEIPLTGEELENWISNLIEDTLDYLGELDVEQEGGTTGESKVTSKPEAGGDEWPGLVNLIPDIELLRLEHIDFPFHCKVGLLGVYIDVCDLITAPIEITINLLIDAFNFVLNDIPDILVDWVGQLVRDVADTIVALPPPFEQASDAFIDYVIFGEEAARLEISEQIIGVIRDEINEAVKDLKIRPEDIKEIADEAAWDLLGQLGLEPPEQSPEFREVVRKFLEHQNLTGEIIASGMRSAFRYWGESLGLIYPEEVESTHCFHVPIDKSLCDACELRIEVELPEETPFPVLSPGARPGEEGEGCPESYPVPAASYSTIVNRCLQLSEDKMEQVMNLYAGDRLNMSDANAVLATMGLSDADLDGTPTQKCVFKLAVLPKVVTKAQEMRTAMKDWIWIMREWWYIEGEEEQKVPWEEIYTETKDILTRLVAKEVEVKAPDLKEVLAELGYTKVPDLAEVIDTTDEAIGAFKALEQMLTDVEKVDPEDIEGLKGPVAELVDALQAIAPQPEEEEEETPTPT